MGLYPWSGPLAQIRFALEGGGELHLPIKSDALDKLIEQFRLLGIKKNGKNDQPTDSRRKSATAFNQLLTGLSYKRTITLVPIFTWSNRSATSSFSMRTHPEETDFPMDSGSVVP